MMPTTCCLYALGASFGPAIAAGGLWRLVAPILLHATPAHLLTNVLFQLRLGFTVERQLGSLKMAILYFVAGIFGNLISAACDPFKLAIGASTSGFGLLGAILTLMVVYWEKYSPAQRMWIAYVGIILTGLMFSTHTDSYGHMFGFVGGICTTLLLLPPGDDQDAWCGSMTALRGLAVAVMLLCTGWAGEQILMLPHYGSWDCPRLMA